MGDDSRCGRPRSQGAGTASAAESRAREGIGAVGRCNRRGEAGVLGKAAAADIVQIVWGRVIMRQRPRARRVRGLYRAGNASYGPTSAIMLRELEGILEASQRSFHAFCRLSRIWGTL